VPTRMHSPPSPRSVACYTDVRRPPGLFSPMLWLATSASLDALWRYWAEKLARVSAKPGPAGTLSVLVRRRRRLRSAARVALETLEH